MASRFAAAVKKIAQCNTAALRTDPSVTARDKFVETVLLPIRDLTDKYFAKADMSRLTKAQLAGLPAFEGIVIRPLEGHSEYDGTSKATVIVNCPLDWFRKFPPGEAGRHVSGKYVDEICDEFCAGAVGVQQAGLFPHSVYESEVLDIVDRRGEYDCLVYDGNHRNAAMLQLGFKLAPVEIHFDLSYANVGLMFAYGNNGKRISMASRVKAYLVAKNKTWKDIEAMCNCNGFMLSPGKERSRCHLREISGVQALYLLWKADILDDTLYVLNRCVDRNGDVQPMVVSDRFIAAVGQYLSKHRATYSKLDMVDDLKSVWVPTMVSESYRVASDFNSTGKRALLTMLDVVREKPKHSGFLKRLRQNYLTQASHMASVLTQDIYRIP